jgi:hypothetical protein
MLLRGRDDHLTLDASVRGARSTRSNARLGERAPTVDARVRELPAISPSPVHAGLGRHIVGRALVVNASRGTSDDVRAHVIVVHVVVCTIHIMVVMMVEPEAPADGDAAVPVPGRRSGSPADVAIADGPRAPGHPSARVAAPGDPRPAVAGKGHPATVMERHPAPVVVRDPDPARVVGVGPVASGDVRLEVLTDLGRGRNPNGAVRRVIDPLAVAFEDGPPLRQRARVGIAILVATLRSDRDVLWLRGLRLRPLRRGLARSELLRRERRRRRYIALRVLRLGLVGSAAAREQAEEAGDGHGEGRVESRDAGLLHHAFTAKQRPRPHRHIEETRVTARFFPARTVAGRDDVGTNSVNDRPRPVPIRGASERKYAASYRISTRTERGGRSWRCRSRDAS